MRLIHLIRPKHIISTGANLIISSQQSERSIIRRSGVQVSIKVVLCFSASTVLVVENPGIKRAVRSCRVGPKSSAVVCENRMVFYRKVFNWPVVMQFPFARFSNVHHSSDISIPLQVTNDILSFLRTREKFINSINSRKNKIISAKSELQITVGHKSRAKEQG